MKLNDYVASQALESVSLHASIDEAERTIAEMVEEVYQSDYENIFSEE